MCYGACYTKETLNCILQICEITQDARSTLHNRITKQIETMLGKNGAQTWIELIIPTERSFIKPDLVVAKGQSDEDAPMKMSQ